LAAVFRYLAPEENLASFTTFLRSRLPEVLT
jgi:hypothetical protein